MGGVCSAGIIEEKFDPQQKKKLKMVRSFGKAQMKKGNFDHRKSPEKFDSGEVRFSISREFKSSTPRESADAKGSPKSSFLGRASFAGLDKAVDVLDTLGSGMVNLSNSGFISGKTSRGNKISILAFEVANTISRGANLMQSLSDENVKFIKEEVLPSEGVQYLVSRDMKVLLSIGFADKREDLDVFCREVIRFGNLCKDREWHNLDRYFAKLDLENAAHKPLREEAEAKMKELTTLALHTSELYHELNALDRFDQDYRMKLEEVKSLNLPRKGEHITILHSELNQQKRYVRSLQKKSLWSKSLEEVIEKLVDIVAYMHQRISDVFGNGVMGAVEKPNDSTQRLGAAGLALHYANLINQIDNIASRPTSLPPNMRDSLYNGLPNSVKTALRSNLRKFDGNEELAVPQIKAEMEKILQWLVPVATNTLKVHQGFGWVGEWANSSNDFNKKNAANGGLIRLQTLYHADKQALDSYILQLVTYLHRLIAALRHRDYGLKPVPFRSPSHHRTSPLHSPTTRRLTFTSDPQKTLQIRLSEEEQKLLQSVITRTSAPGISKSQEFTKLTRRQKKIWVSCRSMGSSPCRDSGQGRDVDLL